MVAATGSGKTVCGIAMASQLNQRTLILVKSKDLATQWREAIGVTWSTTHKGQSRAQDAPLIIGTLSLLSEGLDIPKLSALIFAAPVSAVIDKDNPAATRLIQSIGRCRRPYKDKIKAYVLDIVDGCGFGVSAFNKRMAIYQQQGFEVKQ